MLLMLLFNLNLPLVVYGLITLALTAIFLVLYARWNYGYLEKLGIPVEKPTFMLGSCPDIYKKDAAYEDIRRFQKFGSVFGVYEGRSPQIFIADPDLVKLIMVRDHEHFHVRAPVDLGHAVSNELLDYMHYDKWKAVRGMLTPQLSASKVKLMFDKMDELAQEFVQGLLASTKTDRVEAIDFRERLFAVLVDFAAIAMYGLELENRKDPNNAFVQILHHIMNESTVYDYRYLLIQIFPFLKKIFPAWPWRLEGIRQFEYIMMAYLKKRRAELKESGGLHGKPQDLGDVYVDMMNKVDTPEFQKLGIIPETAIGIVLELFFTVFDSTGTTTVMALYQICRHPEVQERVQEEIDRVMEENGGKLTHDSLNDLTYLHACITEALRLTPPFIRPERHCTKDWIAYREKEFNLPIRIPKGANIVIPIWAMHRHPDYFPDPERYDPERFMPENAKNLHPYAFAGFGHGPKNCIGYKTAYMLMKGILAHILREFTVQPRADTKLSLKKGRLFVFQYDPLYFDFVKRTQ